MRLALAGGGTGGHIVPGLRIVETALRRGVLNDLVWFQTGRPVEERVLAPSRGCLESAACERVVLPMEQKDGGGASIARTAWRTPPAVLIALEAMRRHGSEVLLGLGGYASVPAVLAARVLRIPIGLLEVNASLGKATRYLGPWSERVFHAFEATVPSGHRSLRARRHVFTGPPLRDLELDPQPPSIARETLGFHPDRPLLLVLGGSQGAQALNRFLREHGPSIAARGVSILHQCGPGRISEGCRPEPGYRCEEYLDDVPTALRAATIALCRGGASTLAELACAGVPAWVVPYPHHRDRHQERNAAALAQGFRIVPEAELGSELAAELAEAASPSSDARRARMSHALSRGLPRDGAARLVDELLSMHRPRPGASRPGACAGGLRR
jgi:UDP-N-acetylglucosamine--N-acetylmuramyl-(pentapeptide) pyrophosphoryl-undecaprenol N-acetylglucosamine transferase